MGQQGIVKMSEMVMPGRRESSDLWLLVNGKLEQEFGDSPKS